MLDGGNMGGAMGGHAGAGGFGGSGGNVDGGAGRDSAYGRSAEAARGRGRGRNQAYGRSAEAARGMGLRGPGRDQAYGANAERERGLAMAMAQEAKSRGLDWGNLVRDRDTMRERAVRNRDKHRARDLDPAVERAMWTDEKDIVPFISQYLGLTPFNRLDNMTRSPFDDPHGEWGGGEPQPGMPRHGGFVNGLQGITPELIRQFMHQQALSEEGGNNYDGRYERYNPRSYGDWEAGEAN